MQLNKYSSYCNWHKQSTTGIVQFIDMDYILLSNSLWWKCNLCKLSLLSLLLICLLFIKKKLKIIKDYQANQLGTKSVGVVAQEIEGLKLFKFSGLSFYQFPFDCLPRRADDACTDTGESIWCWTIEYWKDFLLVVVFRKFQRW